MRDKKATRKVVEIIWEDAASLTGAWDELDAVLSKEGGALVRVHSVGYVLADTKRTLILARSIHGGHTVGGVAIIPQSAIVKRRLIR